MLLDSNILSFKHISALRVVNPFSTAG